MTSRQKTSTWSPAVRFAGRFRVWPWSIPWNLSALLAAVCLLTALWPLNLQGRGAEHAANDTAPRILLLNSYHQGLSWTDALTKAVFETLDPLGFEITVEYMDTKRRPLVSSEDYLLPVFAAKLLGVSFDAVIVSDNDALDFAKRHRETLFPQTPIVFCGINYFSANMIDDSGWFTGVMEVTDARGTFDVMRMMLPEMERLTVISDGTPTGLAESRAARADLGDVLDGVEITYIDNPETVFLLAEVAGLHPKTDAVLLTVFNMDAAGRYFTYEESARLITDAAPCPVFGLWDFYLGTGVVGGRMASAADQGRVAAMMAAAIAQGARPAEQPIVSDSPNRIFFDAPALLRHGIEPSRLPQDAVVHNQNPAWIRLRQGGFGRDSKFSYEMFERHGSVMMILDTEDGRILDINQAAADFYGYPLQRMLTMNIKDFKILPVDEVQAALEQARLERVNRFRFNHRLASGQIRDVEVNAWPVHIQGVPVLFSIVQDVTSVIASQAELESLLAERTATLNWRTRALIFILLAFVAAQGAAIALITRFAGRQKKLAAEIEIARDQYQSLVDNIPGITFRCACDEHWTMLYMSDVVDSLTGYPAGDFIHNAVRTFESVIHPDDAGPLAQGVKSAVADGRPWDIEYRVCHKDGDIRWVHEKGRGIPGKDGGVIYLDGFILDITARKQAEDEVKNINQQLQKSNVEKDKLFSIIAHDLRSPMTGLLASTEMLANPGEIISEQEFSVLAKEMHKSARNTFDLLEDLLQWARMSQGGIDFAPEPCGLDELVDMVLSTAQDMAKAKDIAIRQALAQGLTVRVDQPMVKTVIRNILFNAVKFTHRGGEIVIRARQEGRTVTVAIQDNGMGMNEQVVSTIFTLNKVKCHLGTEGEKGTGLGLVLCKQFIEQHGGEIWAESEPGQGTTVFFTLPTNEA